MNCYFSKRIGTLCIALMMGCFGSVYAQCGFQEILPTLRCPGFTLLLQDSTVGVNCANTNWTLYQPAPCSSPIYGTGNCQFSASLNCPGTYCIVMRDRLPNGTPCVDSVCNIVVNPYPILRGSFNKSVTCAGGCIYWIDASVPGINCTIDSFTIDWVNSQPFEIFTVPPYPPNPYPCNTYGANGVYSPRIVLKNSCGCLVDTTFTGAITVTAPPLAAFTGTPLNSCTSPLVSTMTVTTPGANAKYYWYVNGTLTQTSGSPNFIHSYPTGTYDIKLVAVDSLSGCSDSSTQTGYVVVGTYAAACFTANDTVGCAPYTITYTPCVNGAQTYVWNLPGSSIPTVTDFNNSPQSVGYLSSGSYTAQLIVTYPGGCRDTLTKTSYVNLGSVQNLSFTTPDSITCIVPGQICVNYTGSSCATCTFQWNPPPNTPFGTNGQGGTCYTVTAYGTISPLLTVIDSGCTTQLIKNNFLVTQPLVPCVNKSYLHGNGCASDTIIITNCTPSTSVVWSFPGAVSVGHSNSADTIYYNSNGTYYYSMILETVSGCIDTLHDSVIVAPKPVITMGVYPNDVCFGTMNMFTIGSIAALDTPTSVLVWPEGDRPGAPTFIMPHGIDTISYLYPDTGYFGVCFLAQTSGCLGDTTCLTLRSDSVHIFPPKAQYSMSPLCSSSDLVTFTNTTVGADSIIWTYQGVTYKNQNTFVAVLPLCDTKYPISLTAYASYDTGSGPPYLPTDTVYCSYTLSDSVLSRPCYGADFVYNSTKGCYGSFTDTARIVLTGVNVYVPSRILWSVLTSPIPVFNPQGYSGDTSIQGFRPDPPGQYNACVQLSYNNGCIDTICKPLYIDISEPEASFTIVNNDSAGCVPFCPQFTNTSIVIAGAIASLSWNFGDNTPVVNNVPNPVHCFDTTGLFETCLTITDTNGCTSSYCRQVQANLIQANFTETDSLSCPTNSSPLNPITYTNSSTGFVASYEWLLPASLNPSPGGVPIPTTPSITEQYGSTGYDSVGLVVVDQFGICRDTVWKHITVSNPVANYGMTNLSDTFSQCPPLIINHFVDSSQNDICTYLWEFGDGSFATNTNPGHIYTLPGVYPVTEVVTSCHGCVDSITKYNITIKGPSVFMTASSAGGCPCTPISFFISSYNASLLQVVSDGGTTTFTNITVNPIGTATNPTLDTVSFLYCAAGTASPFIEAYDASGCHVHYDSLITPLAIDSPTANFSINRVCGTDSICFTNLTTFSSAYARDSINTWNFGDGTTSNALNPCHVFPGPGNYAVSLFVQDQFLCGDSLTQNVHVAIPPVAYFTFTDTLGCVPFLEVFVDSSTIDDSTSIVNGYWNFGNGATSGIFTGQGTAGDTSYDYTSVGTYTTSLVITDGYGCTDSMNRLVHVLSPPTISAGDDTTICLGDTVTLFGSGSEPLLWLTNYNISSTTSATPKVWPADDTTYILSVGSPTTCYVYDTVKVNVSKYTLSLDTATNLCRNELTSFTASAISSHATVTSYSWTFGDGSPGSTGQTVTHQYATFGSYTSTLIVTNNLGCKDTAVTPLSIFDIPNAALSVTDTVICLGTPITVTNNSTQGASAALSTFYFDMQPDGTPDATTSPFTYTYLSPGHYVVLLVQSDLNQCVDSAEQAITVHALPVPNFNNDTSCIAVDNTYTSSTKIGDGAITTYAWSLNGSPVGTDSSTIHYTFVDSSSNIICLQVTDIYGCIGDTCKQVLIFQNPQITVTPLDTTLCVGYSASFVISGSRFDRVQWVPSAWVSDPTADSVVITPRQTIRYQVYGYYLQCLPAIDTVSIWVVDTVPITATADPQNIVLGLSSNVTSTVQGTIDSIVWDPDSTLNCRNCMNHIATPSITTTYYATVYYHHLACSTCSNDVVCSNRTSVTITVFQSCNNSLIYIPNTFTPNGDGKNDAFRIRGEGIAQVNYFRIYDRWGKLVYEANDVPDPNKAAWNGCLKNDSGSPENSGVYVYVFEIQCVTGQTLTGKGNVTLIR